MQTKRKNHFVPRSYLKRWSLDGKNIQCYRLLVPHDSFVRWQPRAISGIAYKEDLYTSIESGQVDDSFERWIEAEIETPAQEALELAAIGHPLSKENWEKLLLYLAAQDLRTPLSYLEFAERWKRDIPGILERSLEQGIQQLKLLKEGGVLHPEPRHEENALLGKLLEITVKPNARPETQESEISVSLTVGRQLWLQSQKHALAKTATVLLSHTWAFVEATPGYDWFTSDHPVVRVNYYRAGHYDLRGGWGNRGGNIIMPVSPRFMLLAEIGSKLPKRLDLSDGKKAELRKFVAERAHRTIFANRPLLEVSYLRPRRIDRVAYQEEQLAWKDWHQNQTDPNA